MPKVQVTREQARMAEKWLDKHERDDVYLPIPIRELLKLLASVLDES